MKTEELHIIEQIASGDEKTFEQFFKLHYSELCSYAEKFLQDHDDSEEVVQDMFFSMWEKRESLTNVSSLKSYLYRSVRNTCLNKINHNKVKMQYMQHNMEQIKEAEQEIESEDNEGQITTRINQEIDKLPEQRKRIFKLSRFEGLKYKEIADSMGLSIKTIEAQMGKALKTLRTELREYMNVIIIFLIIFFTKQ